MLQFRTKGYQGTALHYSPFYDNKLLVSSSANYGLVGNGRLYVLSIQPTGEISQDIAYDTQDGLFDCAWSEIHENQVVCANGDGSIKMFDIGVKSPFPIMQWKEHQREVYCVNWNLVDKSQFLSTSWDGTVKIWSPQRPQSSLLTLNTIKPGFKNNCAYQGTWNPHNKDMLMSVNANGFVSVFDLRMGQPLVQEFLGHAGFEILTCDWNKYRPNVIATGSVDKSIKIWDLRMIQGSIDNSPMNGNTGSPIPMNQLLGHEFAVKKITWSPHSAGELLSCSYDMSARVWQDYTADNNMSRFRKNQCKMFNRHTEFVAGGEYSLWGQPGWCGTVGWDEMCYVFDSRRL
ncbi:hypothetical protein WICPIJ_002644 [Wickerhamomyces pijperi]|uniref:Peroxin-7 n=1 Tax=Wickerhamomyces pijperi TaxID=599730 RepID=A0A9P8TPZ7_WICPI|nr:hypothetical protein WICPIJ_002644 [Wickerhamomyces pijperi]